MEEIRISWCPERGDGLPEPAYESAGSSGMDVRAAVEMTLAPMERAAVPTGWRVAVPKGFEIQVRARSGLSSKVGLTLINGIGTIDSDFRGEVHILMVNLGREPVAIKRGDRIAQFVVAPVVRARWIRDDVSTAETLRGESGFGSSGIA